MTHVYRKAGVVYPPSRIVARHAHSGGYVMLVFADGTRALEHRYVQETISLRPLETREHVHHSNEVKDDNKPANLEMLLSSEHARLHAKTVERVSLLCAVCGRDVYRTASRQQKNLRRNSLTACSKQCAGLVGKENSAATAAHGTMTAYFKCGPPRCSLCKAAMATYARERRAKQKNIRG